MAQPKKARAGFPFLWTIVGLGLIAFVAVIMRVVPSGADYDTRRRGERLRNLEETLRDARAKLDAYAWVDQEKGIVRLPIERAMELTVAEFKAQGVTPSDVKAQSTGTNLIPAYLKTEAPAAPAEGEAAPATGETAPAAGEAAPAPAAETPATEAPATPAPSPAAEATGPAPAPSPETAPTPAPADDQPAPSPAVEAPATPAPAAPATGEAAPAPSPQG